MGEQILLTIVLFLAIFGCAELIRLLALRILSPSRGAKEILVIPVAGHLENIEYIIRSAAVRRNWGRCAKNRPVLLLDAGMDEETRRLAEVACTAVKGVDLYTPQDLIERGKKLVDDAAECLQYL